MKNLLPTKCVLDDASTIVEPPLHDSNLFKLDFTDADNIDLSFTITSGEICVLHLKGVKYFRCDGLRKGNTVLDLAVYSGESAPFEVLEDILIPPKNNLQKHTSYRKSIKQEILKKRLNIIILSPSYGCKLIALTQSIDYSNI